ncbi:endo alpha-1,4 polygalactosaminidase [Embleya sp. AB8]|uniref:endo alpha-1,4 polygalactosaminidase n=1 Tax=Embleya sp. AB8 TaxID=3156304 RepID=UPI003C766D37
MNIRHTSARRGRKLVLAGVGMLLTAVLAGCGSSGGGTDAGTGGGTEARAEATATATAGADATPGSAAPAPVPASPPGNVVRPEPHTRFDYQLGGPYAPPSGVRAISRDRTARPELGLYNICYLNGFQAQPDALDWWQREHPDLLLRDGHGVVMDTEWNEAVLDISTEAKRTALAAIIGEWIDGCARAGFQAVDPDNYESYSRSHNLLKPADDVAFARLLAVRAHADGLAIAQKNGAELLDRSTYVGFDFAISEQCGQYDECGAFAKAYENRVFVIEYTKPYFTASCRAWGNNLSIILRDRNLTPTGNPSHIYETC